MSRRKIAWIGCSFLIGTGAPAVLAQETGLSDIHAQRIEGGRVCMSEHFHYGSSTGQPSRKAAEAAAIASWVGFTAWEYGDPWGNYRIAASRAMKCTQSGSTWSCETEARPCRQLRATDRRARKN
ncbi:MAG TPA: hypothetical protein VNK52_13990 [Hyphomicrobiaceae bacterium]|nr:hypothetical protein [Hyphomicrobiaceae bacterium]